MLEPCPLCAAERSRVTHELTGYRIARCGACGFEYQPGFGGGGGEDGVFSQDYYQVLQQEAFQAQFEDYARDPSAPVFRRWLEEIERRVPRGRVLDVGSALGTFLRIAADRGWATQGVEISRFAAEYAREKRGLSVFNGDLEAYPGEEGSFERRHLLGFNRARHAPAGEPGEGRPPPAARGDHAAGDRQL